MTTTPSLAGRAGEAFAAYQAGEVGRIGELIDLLTPILWRAARSQRLPVHEAEDVVATAWLRLVDHAHAITDPAAVLGWLMVTVRREAWRRARKGSREVAVADVGTDLPDALPGPEMVALLDQRQQVLWSHIRELSPVCQELLCIVAYADRPDYATVARALGRPIGSIGPTRGRCLTKLREALATDPRWSD